MIDSQTEIWSNIPVSQSCGAINLSNRFITQYYLLQQNTITFFLEKIWSCALDSNFVSIWKRDLWGLQRFFRFQSVTYPTFLKMNTFFHFLQFHFLFFYEWWWISPPEMSPNTKDPGNERIRIGQTKPQKGSFQFWKTKNLEHFSDPFFFGKKKKDMMYGRSQPFKSTLVIFILQLFRT